MINKIREIFIVDKKENRENHFECWMKIIEKAFWELFFL